MLLDRLQPYNKRGRKFDLQPLQSNLKVLQEQQTQHNLSTIRSRQLAKSSEVCVGAGVTISSKM